MRENTTNQQLICRRVQTMIRRTSGGSAEHHWLCSGDAEVPDPISVAHVLSEQLAQSPRSCGGFETGHNLQMERREVGEREGNVMK